MCLSKCKYETDTEAVNLIFRIATPQQINGTENREEVSMHTFV
jgi:hypothetical protein